jgi:membrane fusion protein, copper/silver efflux system
MFSSRTFWIRAAILGTLTWLIVLFVVFGPGRRGEQAATGEWTCSMHPQIRKNGPGQCPICGMDLIPVSQAAKEKERIESRAGVFVEPVQYRELFKEIRAVGKIDYNERQIAFITARIAGRVDRVFADFTGIQVKKDTHLTEIYSPDLYVGQSELIRAVEGVSAIKKTGGDASFAESTLESARTKLRLLGLLPGQIEEIEKSKKLQTHLTIYAPIGGTVIEKNVRQGQYVKEGDVLYRIANLDPVWLYLDLYEYDVGSVQMGQVAQVTVEAQPGERFTGKVVFIDPFLDEKTRTVRARVNLPNPEGKLKPGMYASAVIRARLMPDGTTEPTGLEGKYLCPMHPEVVRDKPGKCDICEMTLEKVPERKTVKKKNGHEGHDHSKHDHVKNEKSGKEMKALAIPASAVLDTGRRKIAYRQSKEGAFELVELELGPRADGKDDQGNKTSYYVVKSGLKAGDRIVVRGGFLLDSQRQIEGMPSLLYPEGQKGGQLHSGHDMPAPKATKDAGHKH